MAQTHTDERALLDAALGAARALGVTAEELWPVPPHESSL